MKKIILASKSQRRKDLLTQAGVSFSVIASDYEEDMSLDMKPGDLVKHLALGKALDVFDKIKTKEGDVIVLGADTFIVFEGKVLGKPKDKSEAKAMLMNFSGKCHSVMTGFALIDSETKKQYTEVVTSFVYFKYVTEKDIDVYIKKNEWVDKAGSYMIQGEGINLIEKYEGDKNNIIGLPVDNVIEAIQNM